MELSWENLLTHYLSCLKLKGLIMIFCVVTGHVYGIGISVPVGECEGKAFEPVSIIIDKLC